MMSILKALRREAMLPRLPFTDILDRPRPPTTKSRLETLPPEIIFEILSHLPLESRGCLATCSSSMTRQLGTQHWFELQLVRGFCPTGSFENYLKLLLRDRSDLYYCRTCLRLHQAGYDCPGYVEDDGIIRAERRDFWLFYLAKRYSVGDEVWRNLPL